MQTGLVAPPGAAILHTDVSQTEILPGIRSLGITAQHIVYDRQRNFIYASVPGLVSGDLGNSIVAIVPDTGEIAFSVFCGSEPTKLALSADGKYLYVGLIGLNAIHRINLITRTADATFYLPTGKFPRDLVVQPRDANVVAVSMYLKGVIPSYAGVAILDNGVLRPQTTSAFGISDVIRFGESSSVLYGLNNETTEWGVRKLLVSATGVKETSALTHVLQLSGGPGIASMEYAAGRLFLTSGLVLNAGDWSSMGGYPASGPVLPDSARDRVYFLTRPDSANVTLQAYVLSDGSFAEEIRIPTVGQPFYPTRWGQTGLAFLTTNHELILSAGYLVPPSLAPPPSPVLTGLAPSSIGSGAGETIVTLTGFSFTPESVVRIAGREVETIFGGDSELMAIVPASDLLTPGGLTVEVVNTGPIPTTSGSMPLLIAPGIQPAARSIVPAVAYPGTEFTATIAGQNLAGASRISFSDIGVTAVVNTASDSLLSVTIQIDQRARIGTYTFKIDANTGTSPEFSGLIVRVGERVGAVPIIHPSNSTDFGMALSNPTNTEAVTTLIARDYNGNIITGTGITNPSRVIVPPSAQIALRADELFGAGMSGRNGWIEILSTSTALQGMFLVFDAQLTYADGAAIQTSGSRQILFPNVRISQGTSTFLSYVNTGDADLDSVDIHFFDSQQERRFRVRIPARSGFAGPASALLPGVSEFTGYTVIEDASNNPTNVLTGFETYKNQGDIAALNAFPDSASLRTGYLAHFVSQGGFSSRIVLINYSSSSQTVRITASGLERDGRALNPTTVERSLPMFARLEESVDQMFGLSEGPLISG